MSTLKQGLCVWSPPSVLVSSVWSPPWSKDCVCEVHFLLASSVYEAHLEARIVCVKSTFCWCLVCTRATLKQGLCVWSLPSVLVSSVWCPPWSKDCVCEVCLLSWCLVYDVHLEARIVCVKSTFCRCLVCMRATLKQGLCVWSPLSVGV